MAGVDGITIAIESTPAMIDRATNCISKHHKYLLDTRRIVFVQDCGSKGWNYYGPYDAI
ncbi:unnamed protein product, partial [Notodromas monacha]